MITQAFARLIQQHLCHILWLGNFLAVDPPQYRFAVQIEGALGSPTVAVKSDFVGRNDVFIP